MVKPPPMPRPGTGGGGMAMMKAPWIADGRLRRSAVMAVAVNPFFAAPRGLLEHREERRRIPGLRAGRAREPANAAT